MSILVLNTVGILPILYYFFFSGRQLQEARQQAAAASQTKQATGKARKKR